MDYNFCVPCLLGLEGPISDELRRLDIPGVRAENGRVYFTGGGEELARANINLRIGERILLEVGGFSAVQVLAILIGLPLSVLMFIVIASAVKALREDNSR